jgi:hypothetical protein
MSQSGTSNIYIDGYLNVKTFGSSTAGGSVCINNYHTLSLNTGSSKRWKHEIEDLKNKDLLPQKLYNIPVRQFIFNEDYLDSNDERYNKIVCGLIAEEVEEFYPIAANHDAEGNCSNWNHRFLIPPMLALIQEQHKQIDDLQSQINELKEKINGNSSI